MRPYAHAPIFWLQPFSLGIPLILVNLKDTDISSKLIILITFSGKFQLGDQFIFLISFDIRNFLGGTPPPSDRTAGSATVNQSLLLQGNVNLQKYRKLDYVCI